ncbi:hypothetical protein MP228_000222 [Amoeboaphelidium protococcarum]|nr:hypothetical protein MP228_000222 [Amoeboaphelidium protococcarum]
MSSQLKKFDSVFRDQLFDDAVVLVTGGGTGIGRVLSHELVRLGARVVVAARREDVLKRTCDEINSIYPGSRASFISMNIRSAESVRNAVNEIVSRHGKITHLVNNSGGQFLSPAADISDKGWRAVVDTNLNGTWTVTKAVFDQCMKQNGGVIVNVIVASQNGFPFMAHSGAARAGVENLTKSLASEWGQYGIRVNSVAPGTILGNGIKTNYPKEVQDLVLKKYKYQVPAGRLGMETEVASGITWLLSKGSSFVTGITLKVDGGITLAVQDLVRPGSDRKMLPAYDGFNQNVEQSLGPSVDDKFKAVYNEYVKSKL